MCFFDNFNSKLNAFHTKASLSAADGQPECFYILTNCLPLLKMIDKVLDYK